MTLLPPAAIAKRLQPLTRLPAPPRSLALAERTGELRRIAEVAGNTVEGRRAAELLKSADSDVRAFDVAEWGIRAGAGVAEPSMMVMRLLSMGRSLRGSKFASALSDNDKMFVLSGLFGCILTQSERGLKETLAMASGNVLSGYVSQAAGLMREVYGRNLRPIAEAVHTLREEVAAAARRSPELEVIDSSLIGPVQVPTRLNAGERALELGTDRIVGVGIRSPEDVTMVLENGASTKLRVQGSLDPKIACEVKAKTTVPGGISQIIRFQDRGNHGYIQLGDELWRLSSSRLDRLTNFVVAPGGPAFQVAKREASILRQLGIRIALVELPAAEEAQIMAAARGLVEDVAKHALARP
jgi:hypothetical protein